MFPSRLRAALFPNYSRNHLASRVSAQLKLHILSFSFRCGVNSIHQSVSETFPHFRHDLANDDRQTDADDLQSHEPAGPKKSARQKIKERKAKLEQSPKKIEKLEKLLSKVDPQKREKYLANRLELMRAVIPPKNRKMPPKPMWLIKEDELEESFIKGGGPGGQKVNKSSTKVQITHLPTGIVVSLQYSRDQKKNRVRAREILAMKLEQMENPQDCRLNAVTERKQRLKANKKKKLLRKQEQLAERELPVQNRRPTNEPTIDLQETLN